MGLEKDITKYSLIIFPLLLGIFLYATIEDVLFIYGGIAITILNYLFIRITKRYDNFD